MVQYLRAIILNCKIKRLTFSFKEKAHIRDNATAGHLPAIALAQARRAGWIKDKIAGFCEIEEGVRN